MLKDFRPAHTSSPQLATEGRGQDLWFYVDHRVLYCDTDLAKVVYHGNYLKYFEIGRTSLIRFIGSSYKQIEDSGFFHPVVDMRVKFEDYLEYDDEIAIYVRPIRAETVCFSFDYRILKKGHSRVAAWGETKHCCINGKKIPVPIDPITRALFKRMNGDSSEPRRNEPHQRTI